MMCMFRKYYQRFKSKVCPVLLLICLISCICSPFASAADVSGEGYVSITQYRHIDVGQSFQVVRNVAERHALPFSNVLFNGLDDGNSTYQYATYGLNTVSIPNLTFTTPVTIYFSAFVNFPVNSHYYRNPWLVEPIDTTFTATSTDPDSGVVSTSSQVGVSTFAPVSSQAASRKGIILDAKFTPSDLQPAYNISINGNGSSLFAWDNTEGYPQAADFQIVSFRAVTTETSAELEGLEAIADQIVAQSEMMEAFYGDIVAICNQIYSRLGDMQTTAELANIYFQQMIALLRSIDTTVTNIYDLLPVQFAMLETAIETASTDIVAAVQAQTNALIAYFDSVFSGAVGNLPDKSEDLETNIGNVGTAENEYKSNASSTFEQLSADFTGFTGGTLSGIALASNLFTQVWNSLGEYSVVYSFPLLLGISLLLIGRVSRYDKAQSAERKRQERINSRNNGG